jgi:hypothetical protein
MTKSENTFLFHVSPELGPLYLHRFTSSNRPAQRTKQVRPSFLGQKSFCADEIFGLRLFNGRFLRTVKSGLLHRVPAADHFVLTAKVFTSPLYPSDRLPLHSY